MISVNCLNCKKPFEAQRKSAKFCSDLCRVTFNQKKGQSDDKPTEFIETDNQARGLQAKIDELEIENRKLRLEIEGLKQALNEPKQVWVEKGIGIKLKPLETESEFSTKEANGLDASRLEFRKKKCGF
jgi:hypothetical protein